MKKILIVNGDSYGKAVLGLGDLVNDPEAMFREPEQFSLVMFTGGEDVTPELYGESSPKGYCGNSRHRDLMEIKIFEFARKHNIRTIGICRGIQFINMMSGGTMFHHVENHGGCNHIMATSRGEEVLVNSYHHQMVLPPRDAHLIGWSKERRSKLYYGDMDLLVPSPSYETEAVLFPNTESAGAQYHPEMMSRSSDGYAWFYELAEHLINQEDFNAIVTEYTGKACKDTDQFMRAVQ